MGLFPRNMDRCWLIIFYNMKVQNIIIDVLGIDNEINFNDSNITPQKHMQIVDYLRDKSTEQNFKMPLIIGPERYEPTGNVENCWWEKFLDSGWGDRIDIYGTHYYPTDLEMDAFMWRDYQQTGNLRGCLMRATSVPLRGARPITIVDHDGVDTSQKSKL